MAGRCKRGNVIKDSIITAGNVVCTKTPSAPEATAKAYVSGVLDKNDAHGQPTPEENHHIGTMTWGYNYAAKFGIKRRQIPMVHMM